ncbi:hypothetical protein NDU88_001276 [Pleurodeles waltl]|uniref:Uncharacterized protein n=1 Tax=Pleurodeles waltl TaxID=8319 RepID=A0AAV7SYW2_PLEWA|nr:hypothetical protein NDU88_001276 [Pleurodeles waltl]
MPPVARAALLGSCSNKCTCTLERARWRQRKTLTLPLTQGRLDGGRRRRSLCRQHREDPPYNQENRQLHPSRYEKRSKPMGDGVTTEEQSRKVRGFWVGGHLVASIML